MTVKRLEKQQKKSAAGKPNAKAAAAAPYHHGSLHEALLQAAETILEREGLQGLTLRAAAREAGVSHAAPTHHFGDMTGLLSDLAAAGFRHQDHSRGTDGRHGRSLCGVRPQISRDVPFDVP